MKTVAIITARGGSKRIPRKNIKPFLGKPIIEYPIRAALESGCFDEVMVSTDDEEIAEIAKKAGASVPFMRSSKNADDHATTAQVLLEVLKEYQKRGQIFDYMACLYPTNPFISVPKIQNAMKLIQSGKYAEIVPVVPFSFPPLRAFVFSEERGLEYKWEQFKNSRSQDLEKMYHDAGQYYFYDARSFLENEGVKGMVYPVICSEHEVQDIDNEEDWKMAELKVEFLRRQKGLTE